VFIAVASAHIGFARADDAVPTPIRLEQPRGSLRDDFVEDERCWWLPEVTHKNDDDLLSYVLTPANPAALPTLPVPHLIDSATPRLREPTRQTNDPWATSNLRPDGAQRVASANTATDFLDLSAKVKLRERDAFLEPSAHNTWETDQTMKVPVAGSLFVFNQVTGSTPDVDQQQYKWLGKTGVGLKIKPWLFQEVQLRTGPAVRFDDTGTLSKGQSPEHSELFVEAVTKLPVPVLGPLNLEYSTYAVPAATPSDRNQINQDFKVALPIAGGQFHVGAKYKWEAANSTPWMDRMQLYMGVQNKW
jgi:hypothetical protein